MSNCGFHLNRTWPRDDRLDRSDCFSKKLQYMVSFPGQFPWSVSQHGGFFLSVVFEQSSKNNTYFGVCLHHRGNGKDRSWVNFSHVNLFSSYFRAVMRRNVLISCCGHQSQSDVSILDYQLIKSPGPVFIDNKVFSFRPATDIYSCFNVYPEYVFKAARLCPAAGLILDIILDQWQFCHYNFCEIITLHLLQVIFLFFLFCLWK